MIPCSLTRPGTAHVPTCHFPSVHGRTGRTVSSWTPTGAFMGLPKHHYTVGQADSEARKLMQHRRVQYMMIIQCLAPVAVQWHTCCPASGFLYQHQKFRGRSRHGCNITVPAGPHTRAPTHPHPCTATVSGATSMHTAGLHRELVHSTVAATSQRKTVFGVAAE